MDFESIIWIVIFLIYVVSVILKRIRRASKSTETATAKTHSGWKEKLTRFQSQIQDKFGGFLNEIKQEMEAAKQKDSKKETGWEKFLTPKDDEPEPAAKKTEMIDVSLEPSREIVREEITLEWEDAAEEKEPAASEKERLPKDLAYGTRDLRRAVIWSEILAPPLALRDE